MTTLVAKASPVGKTLFFELSLHPRSVVRRVEYSGKQKPEDPAHRSDGILVVFDVYAVV
jgi:hypothetical protein